MRTPMKFSGKPQSYVKTLEARIAALEATVSALVMVNGSPELAQALKASMRWHEEFMQDPATRTPPEFVRDWRAAVFHLLTEPTSEDGDSPAATPNESADPQARSTD